MSEKLQTLDITEFCKKASNSAEVWQDTVGATLRYSGGISTISKIKSSENNLVEAVVLNGNVQTEKVTINNLQSQFRSITIKHRLFIKLFKPEQFSKMLVEEKKKKEIEDKYKLERKIQKEKEAPFIKELNGYLIKDFLSAEEQYALNLSEKLSKSSYLNFKAIFVKKWLSAKVKAEVDFQQAKAISSVNKHTIVTARAGSGKTATLVNRIVFLNKKCGINPNEFLVLAFNRNAAKEIRERLKIATGKDFKQVMTFHSLAYSLVHPAEAILYDDPKSEEFNQSSIIQSLIDEYLKDTTWSKLIRKVMVSHFKEDWDFIASRGFNLSTEEMLEFRRSSPKVGLDGWYYKSFGEKKIADFLYEHGLTYEYEKNFWWNKINYKPDFTLSHNGKKIVIEYFGLAGHPDYDKEIEKKRAYWSKSKEYKLLEIYPNNLTNSDNKFETFLNSELSHLGISLKKLSDEELWEKIQHRAVDQFSRLCSLFINRIRQNSYSPEDFQNLVKKHEFAFPYEEDFLKLIASIFEGYSQRIIDTGEDDFSGLMIQAVQKMLAGTSEIRKKNHVGDLKSVKFIMIDEFQDFTELFYKCIEMVLSFNKQARVFCVGDDWQAINSFAGSDLRYFKLFPDFFSEIQSEHIQKNYRSTTKIVEAGNALMKGQGSKAIPASESAGNISLVDLGNFEPSDRELQIFENQVFLPALLRLIRQETKKGKNITLLARNNYVPWHTGKIENDLEIFFIHMKKFLTEQEKENVNCSTIHSFKGKQSDVIILVDFKQRIYPFIHPTYFFTRIFGDTVRDLLAEEKRLLYVALTRAKSQLYLVGETADLPSISQKFASFVSNINWESYPEVLENVENNSDLKIVSIVGKTYQIKELLKSAGYRWTERKQAQSGSWSKTIDFKGSSFIDFFRASSWVENADDVKILVQSTGGVLETELTIRDGQLC